MENQDWEFLEDDDDILRVIDFEAVYDQYDNMMFDLEPPLPTEGSPSVENLYNSSPDSMSSLFGEIENQLMNDDDDKVDGDSPTQQQFCNDFLADILVDSPPSASASGGEISADDKDSSPATASKTKEKEKESKNNNGDGDGDCDGDDPDDPMSKKRKRCQLILLD